MIDIKALATLVAAVPRQVEVFNADMAAAREQAVEATAAVTPPVAPEVVAVEKSARDQAIDGAAWHVFNTLRGTADDVEGAKFEDVRALVAEAFL